MVPIWIANKDLLVPVFQSERPILWSLESPLRLVKYPRIVSSPSQHHFPVSSEPLRWGHGRRWPFGLDLGQGRCRNFDTNGWYHQLHLTVNLPPRMKERTALTRAGNNYPTNILVNDVDGSDARSLGIPVTEIIQPLPLRPIPDAIDYHQIRLNRGRKGYFTLSCLFR